MNTEENQVKEDKKVIQLNPETAKEAVAEAPTQEGTQEQPEGQAMHYDPNEFGYLQGERVPFTGNLILSFMGFLNQIAIKETQVLYEPQDNFKDTYATGKEVVSDLGLQAIRYMEFITEEHLMNIDNGAATHMDILKQGATAKKPAFEVDTVEKGE
ncbi:MAG: hypothetical protein PQJ49_01815 [Sphaerochaetaceae bacterium]|nr:hypothetical protein [Sphaerochaetaceae bacterium]